MLIVTLNGSPNANGNTASLLNTIENELETLNVNTQRLHLAPLLEASGKPFCDVCTARCSGICYQGTPLEDAYDLLKQASGLVIATPVYFGTVSAQIKAFFDKTRKLRNEKGLYNAIGTAVTVGASRFGGQETTIKALHDIMLVHGMLIAGDGYAEADCGHQGVCAQRPADEDFTAHDRARLAAHRIAEVAQAMHPLRKHH